MRGRSLWPTLFGLFLIACGLLQILFIAMMVGKAYLPWTTWGIADTWAIPGLCIGIGVLSLAAGVSRDRIDRRRRAKRCRPQERRARRRVFLTFLLLGTIVSIASYWAIMSYLGDGGHPPVKALTLWWFTVCGVPLIMILSGLCGAFIQIGGRTPRPGHWLRPRNGMVPPVSQHPCAQRPRPSQTHKLKPHCSKRHRPRPSLNGTLPNTPRTNK